MVKYGTYTQGGSGGEYNGTECIGYYVEFLQHEIMALNVHRVPYRELKNEAVKTAVSALEEIRQYRALGIVEELGEIREKQIPRKPVTYKETNRADCPVCGAAVRGITGPFGDWCSKCAQKLDWDGGDAE